MASRRGGGGEVSHPLKPPRQNNNQSMDNSLSDLRVNIKILGLKKSEISHILGVSASKLSLILSGKRRPPERFFIVASVALGVLKNENIKRQGVIADTRAAIKLMWTANGSGKHERKT